MRPRRHFFIQASILAVAAAFLGHLALGGGKSGLETWLGVYKYRFQNAMADGTSYESENILEIAAVDKARAYVRADLEFTNGHGCRFYGIARLEAAKLIYRARAGSHMGDQCVLSLERKGDQIVLHDPMGSCRNCGARGFYDGASFPAESRQRIRYLPRLKASNEFQQAMAEASSD